MKIHLSDGEWKLMDRLWEDGPATITQLTHALEGVPGASQVQVSLDEKKATVAVAPSVTDEALKAAVEEAGYQVTEIKTYEG